MANTETSRSSHFNEFYPAQFPDDVPIASLEKISVQKLLNQDEETAKQLFAILCTDGFFYLDLTTDPLGQQFEREANQLHDIAKYVFNSINMEEKTSYKRGDPLREHLDFGYTATHVDENGEPDTSELINISTYRLLNDSANYQLPCWLSAHTRLYGSFMKNGHAIGQSILRILEQELHLQAGELTDLHQLKDKSGEFVRLFRYPAPKAGQFLVTSAAHTDATSMTILFNWQGGLQITKPKEEVRKADTEIMEKENEEWLYIKPEPRTVIINLGDPMVVFTNGLLKSGRHRVVTPPGQQAMYHRYSVLTNLRPANDTPMRAFKSDVIPPTVEGEEQEQPLTALEWSIAKGKAFFGRMASK